MAKSKKLFPMSIRPREETNNPEVPLAGSPSFLTLCKELLTPEEIKKAREKGKADHERRMELLKRLKGQKIGNLSSEEVEEMLKQNCEEKDEPKEPPKRWASLDAEGKSDLLNQIEKKLDISPRKVTSKAYKQDQADYEEYFAPQDQGEKKFTVTETIKSSAPQTLYNFAQLLSEHGEHELAGMVYDDLALKI
jgi:hypothetical protein